MNPTDRRLALLLAAVVLALLPGRRGVVRAEDEPPSLARALYLEKTARDPKAALPVFEAVVADPATDASARADARLGEARCLLALGRDADAVAAWHRLEDDSAAPTAAREEAKARREEHARAQASAADAEAEAKAHEAMRRAEEARLDAERRLQAAARLVESAAGHVRAKRYEPAREDLLKALELNPNDERAAAMLEELGQYTDRGELLRQAIRFVATNRVVDWRRLSTDVDGLRRAGSRLLREGKPNLAAKSFKDAIGRIDASDFYADLGEARRELVVLLRKALDDARARGLPLGTDVEVPADRPEPAPGVRPWRGEFFALLGRIFTSDADAATPLRFLDLAVAPDPAPDPHRGGFSASGIAASPAPGTLRRARWVERYLREQVAPGTWTGPDRLLERYDDLLVVQHASGVLRAVDDLVAAFPQGPPPPAVVEVRVYAAAPGGVADALRFLEVRAAPGEPGTVLAVPDRRLDEQVEWLSRSDRLVPLAQASVVLTGRHATQVRFREPTASCPFYVERGAPPIAIPDRQATYGLDLDLYAEDLPGMKGQAALSVAATVIRPDRPRLVPLAGGFTRVPVFLTQTLEADRRVPHGGGIMLLGLTNPFLGTGAAGDLAGGSHPDLLVLVAAGPAAGVGTADVAPVASPGKPAGSADTLVREYDLGPLGSEVADEPPPEDWPESPFGDAARPEAARALRDAFLGGWLSDHAGLPPGSGAVVVRDGRVTATLHPAEHQKIAEAVEALAREEKRLFAIEVRATEVTADRAGAWLAEAGARSEAPEQRVWRLDAGPASALEERLRGVPDSGSLFTTDARLAARHTQLVTTRSVRSRSIVESFRIVRREDGSLRTVPVNGTTEEGLLVAVRPVASVGGLASVYVNAVLARLTRMDSWTPSDVPGTAPTVQMPRHAVERAGGFGVLSERDTLLLVVPVPGTDGTRVVLIRARQMRG